MSHIHEAPPPLPDDVPEVLAGVIEDLLAKDPLDRPDNARAVAYRLGLADHEMAGLAIGLAHAVYGESTLDDDDSGHGTAAHLRSLRRHGRRRPGRPARGLSDTSFERVTGPLHGTEGGRDVDDVALQLLHEATVVADATTDEKDRVLLPVTIDDAVVAA